MSIRTENEALEKQILWKHACLSGQSRGRQRQETPCEIRTDFARDRDRIVHSKAFRRLKHKAQVFIAPDNDHYRTRLTHTLEVSQIAATISKALRLNQDLTEAISLGHDLGHTPFGHTGERMLDELSPDGFQHYRQSLRVVDVLEKGGAGLNLTYEVRNGILNHTGDMLADTYEGQVIKFADRIAYLNHDIDDAIRAGMLTPEDIPKDILDTLGHAHSARINTLITDLINTTKETESVGMSQPIWDAMMELRRFMFAHVYTSPAKQDSKVELVIEHLYSYFLQHIDELPPEFLARAEQDGKHRVVCDYIASMTDSYSLRMFEELFVPKTWSF